MRWPTSRTHQRVRYIVDKMVDEVLAVDPYFLALGAPLDLAILLGDAIETRPFATWKESLSDVPNEAFFLEYDAALGDWQQSRLAGFDPNAEATMASAIRAVLARAASELSDADAIAQVLDPRLNPNLGHPLFLGMNSKLMQTMNHIPFTFQKRISGAEDAQNQRHRGTLSSSPLLLAHQRREPDVMVPWAIQRNPDALREYHETVTALWSAKNALLDAGVSRSAVSSILRRTAIGCGSTNWHAAQLLLEMGQTALFRRPAGDLLDRGRRSRSGARTLPHRRAVCGRSALCPAFPRRFDADLPEEKRFCGIPVWRACLLSV
ncbi:MAG: FAD-dependent thymidylate synthase [Thermomicrobiales bacterium]